MILSIKDIPQKFVSDIHKAVQILKKEGCTDIFIFGLLVQKKFTENSDIDIAVRGLPSSKYFKAMGELLLELDSSVDLVDLDDKDNRFARMLVEKGKLLRVE